MTVDFSKYTDGLVPCVVQDAITNKVLMLGFMNEAALETTKVLKKVTFFSRSKQRLWTKGEQSGHFLYLQEILVDCDSDTLLLKVNPAGPVCHTGADTCFNETNTVNGFLQELDKIISERKSNPTEGSYTSTLFGKGINAMAQKVGEEAVEMIIEAKDNNDELFKNEAADLLFHYMVLLQAKGFQLSDVEAILKERHK